MSIIINFFFVLTVAYVSLLPADMYSVLLKEKVSSAVAEVEVETYGDNIIGYGRDQIKISVDEQKKHSIQIIDKTNKKFSKEFDFDCEKFQVPIVK